MEVRVERMIGRQLLARFPSQFLTDVTFVCTADMRFPRSRITASCARTSCFSSSLKEFHPSSSPYARQRNFIFYLLICCSANHAPYGLIGASAAAMRGLLAPFGKNAAYYIFGSCVLSRASRRAYQRRGVRCSACVYHCPTGVSSSGVLGERGAALPDRLPASPVRMRARRRAIRRD